MSIVMLVSMLLIAIGGLVMSLTMCASVLSSDPMRRDGAVPQPITSDLAGVSARLQQV
jgi:hypothetical protein